MKKFTNLSALILSLLLTSPALAEIAVIVNPASGITSLTEDDVSRIFLGKSKAFPNGSTAVPVNQDEGSATRDKFNEAVCKKNSSQYKAYWSQLVFTGKGTPPKDAGNDAAVKTLVAASPTSIGYVDASAVDASVKVVYKIP
ncbi:MAG: phosphate ABC transporter substrate-binding protein [Cellvibrio sp.]